MKCNQCASCDTKVIESRDVSDGTSVRRRRECIQCEHRFTTYERIERPQLIVVKSDGKRELFKRDKILAGLYRACEKTPVSTLEIDRLVTAIETELQDCGEQEVASAKIGDLVMRHLSRLNDVAYVRFASVYRRFTDIAGFEKELSHIRKNKTGTIQT